MPKGNKPKLKAKKTITKVEEMRKININADQTIKYVSNFITTAKYNL